MLSKMKNLKKSDIKPLDFGLMMKAAKTNGLTEDGARATQEINEVPEQVWAEMEVRQGLARVVPEVREKIRNGEPF